MTVSYDANPVGYSGAVPNGLPFSLSWLHSSATVSNTQPGVSAWFVSYKSGVDIVTGSTRTCTIGGVAMVSQNVIALAGNNLLIENFVLVGQPTGDQPLIYTYSNMNGVKPAVIRGDSESFKGVLGFGTGQSAKGTTANGSLVAISATGEMLSVCSVARAANISATSGTQRFIKNNVIPRVAITDESGAATKTVTMTANATDWGIGVTRVLPGASEPPVTPPAPPTLPAVIASPLGGVGIALYGQFTPSADVTVYPMDTTAPAYSSPTTFAWNTDAAKFRIGGTLILSDHNGFQCGVNSASGQDIETNPLTAGLTSFETEFWLTAGKDLTIKFRNFTNSDYLILIDDLPATQVWQNFTSGAGYKYVRLVFADDLPHRIRVLHGCNGFCGVIVPSGGDIAPAGARYQIAVTGDSYVQGAGSASEPGPVMAGGIVGTLSLFMGAECINLGQGTTGYLADGVGGSRTRFGSAARLARLDAWSPSTIIVLGGGNDTSGVPADVATAANTMWNAIATAHPAAKLVVVGIQSPNLFPAAGMTALNLALRNAALANANVDLWIDMRIPEFWVTDTTQDLFITTEFPASIHPGKAGSMNIVQRMMLAIAMKGLA